MFKLTPICKTALLWCVLSALLAASFYNQYNFSLKPLYLSRDYIVRNISRHDTERLQVLAPDLVELIQAVNTFPVQTRFYFMPCFQDSGNTARWWWYVFLMVRYFTYPRIIISHNAALRETKEAFVSKYIGKARTYQDIDWLTSKNVEVIILMRNNKVEFLGMNAPIGGL